MVSASIDWKSAETRDALLVGVVATLIDEHGKVKLDMKALAHYLGTSYDSVEKHMRTIKAKAREMKNGSSTNTLAAPKRKTANVDQAIPDHADTSPTKKPVKRSKKVKQASDDV